MAVYPTHFEKTIRALLADKKYQSLKDILITLEPADIAGIFEDLDDERIPLLFRLLPKLPHTRHIHRTSLSKALHP